MADNLPPSSADVIESGSLNFPEPSGPHRPVKGLFYIICGYLKSALRCKFLILDNYIIQTFYIYKSRVCMSICGYFSKLKGVCEQKCLGNAGSICLWLYFILATGTVFIRTSLSVTYTVVL
jgi:hypothetical protein